MMRELKFLARDKVAIIWLAIAFTLSIITIAFGLREVELQKMQINELITLDKVEQEVVLAEQSDCCLLYTSPSPRDRQKSRMPSSA